MLQKIIALAVAGLMSGAAFAQSNVTIYGALDAGVARFSGTSSGTNGNNTARTAMVPGAQVAVGSYNTNSRLGFRGEEDLGGGMKAEFTVEVNVAADGGGIPGNNGPQVAGQSGLDFAGARQTFLGLKGNWGGLRVGRQYTPFFSTVAAVDPFGVTGPSSAGVIHPIVSNVARANNAITYTSPSFSGVSISAMVAPSEKIDSVGTTTGNGGGVTSWNAIYANGPMVVGLSQIYLRDVNVSTSATATGAATLGVTLKSTVLGGTYNFGVAKLHLAYNTFATDGLAPALAAGNGEIKHGDWHVGVSAPFGAHTVKFAWNRANDKATSNEDANQFGLGYEYALSKRTKAYGIWSKVSNKNGAAYSASFTGTTGLFTSHGAAGALNAGSATVRESALGFGLVHTF